MEGVRVGEGVRVEGEMENQSGSQDGEELKNCATTGLYEPPPPRGKRGEAQKGGNPRWATRQA